MAYHSMALAENEKSVFAQSLNSGGFLWDDDDSMLTMHDTVGMTQVDMWWPVPPNGWLQSNVLYTSKMCDVIV